MDFICNTCELVGEFLKGLFENSVTQTSLLVQLTAQHRRYCSHNYINRRNLDHRSGSGMPNVAHVAPSTRQSGGPTFFFLSGYKCVFYALKFNMGVCGG